MNINFSYIQKRSNFGKSCKFSDSGPYLIVDIDPDPKLKSQFTEIPRIDKETQYSREMSLHEVNTLQHPTTSQGINHIIGGWPSDVDPKDEDQVARFKKKIEKDEAFISSIKMLGSLVENFVMENNSVDIYEEYFMNEKVLEDTVNQFKTVSVFRDYSEKSRKVLDMSWALDGCKLAAAHAFSESCTDPLNVFHESYIWDIENSSLPYCILFPQGSLRCIEYSPRDLELLIGGYSNGQIGLWDIRAGGDPQQMTPLTKSHKESVLDMKWISSKTGYEFFSCSTDGKLFCWDSRNLNSCVKTLQFDIDGSEETATKLYGITCIEYDPSLPHRFTLGTEQGTILSCNQKLSEIVSSCYKTHTVPIINITRNHFFPKLFASCCAWDVKIWSEDLTVSPILTLRSLDEYCCNVSWSQSHPSILFITKTSGHLELWDILIKSHEPIMSVKLESGGLTCVLPKQQGEQLVCGTASGCIHLLNVPGYYASSTKQDKNLVAAMIDREGKREKFLECKNREQRLKKRMELKQTEVLINSPSPTEFLTKSPTPNDVLIKSPSPIPRDDDILIKSSSPIPEKVFNIEDEKLDVAENGEAEFNSIFDPNLKGDNDEVGETSSDKILFDMQYCDVLNTVLNVVKQINPS